MTAVITISIDDLFNVYRYADAFGVRLHTPNFDRLAEMGVSFENAYAPVAVCNPSRTSALSGLSPFRTGLHSTDDLQWSDVMSIGQTVVGMFTNAGFTTYGTGKVFHNQTSMSQSTLDQIYSHSFQPRPENLATLDNVISDAQEDDEQLRDDLSVPWAVDQLLNYDGSDDAFFTVGIIRPHMPFIAPQEFLDLYPKDQLVLPYVEGDLDDVSPFYQQFRLMDGYQNFLENNDAELDFLQGYFAGISYADAMLGRLLDAIEQNPELADAAIVVWSDHGYQLGEKHTWNKFTMWEEAANIPFVVVAPGLTGGTTVSTPVSLLDLTPTLLDLGGIAPPAGTEFDGRSMLDFIDSPEPGRVAITSMLGSLSMRSGDYRFIFYNDGSVELYDLATDPGQIVNLAQMSGNAALVASLTDQLVAAVADQGGFFDPDALTLIGTNGTDSMYAIGDQTLQGGLGDDVYFVTDQGTVIEEAGGGFDTVIFATTTFVVPENIEFVANSYYVNNNALLTVTGNAQNNFIKATSTRALIHAGAGDDTIETAGARDQLFGEGGNDAISAGGGKDSLYGGEGDDILEGEAGADHIDGGPGIDTIAFSLSKVPVHVSLADNLGYRGDALDDTYIDVENIEGSNHDDTLIGDIGGNRIAGGKGNDSIAGGTGDDVLMGGLNNDILQGEGGADHLSGDEGDDSLNGSADADLLDGGSGNDLIFAGVGNDVADGGGGDDVIYGQGGFDTIRGDVGADTLNGGAGDDDVMGGLHNDDLHGSGGNDRLAGDEGDDTLSGGSGADHLLGGDGNDRIYNGLGADRADGGLGNDIMSGHDDGARDVFVFHFGYGNDAISAFERHVDRLELDDALWAASGTLTPQQVIDTFGTLNENGTGFTLDFGNGDVLEVWNVNGIDVGTLADYVLVV
jgi:arylsulfatase A-like enzyme